MSKSQASSRVRWGDVDESDDLPSSTQPQQQPTSAAATNKAQKKPTADKADEPIGVVSEVVDKSTGIKTVVEYSTNIDGHRIKITRRIKTTVKPQLVNKNVLQRRKWKKFGEARGAAPGPEFNVTIPSNESIILDLKPKKREEQQVEESALDKIKGGTSIVVCSYCKEPGHFSLKCPKRTSLAPRNLPTDPDASASSASDTAPGGSKYVPMHMRSGAGTADDKLRELRDQEPTLRVTNLSEDVTEADLHELFRRFGHTTRIYLAKDRITNVSRGFAFVNFASRTDAQLAIDKLNGHGYDNLILHVEWAKAKEQK